MKKRYSHFVYLIISHTCFSASLSRAVSSPFYLCQMISDIVIQNSMGACKCIFPGPLSDIGNQQLQGVCWKYIILMSIMDDINVNCMQNIHEELLIRAIIFYSIS